MWNRIDHKIKVGDIVEWQDNHIMIVGGHPDYTMFGFYQESCHEPARILELTSSGYVFGDELQDVTRVIYRRPSD